MSSKKDKELRRVADRDRGEITTIGWRIADLERTKDEIERGRMPTEGIELELERKIKEIKKLTERKAKYESQLRIAEYRNKMLR